MTEDSHIDVGEISMDELLTAIRRLKRQKAAGPDEVPIEFFKEMKCYVCSLNILQRKRE